MAQEARRPAFDLAPKSGDRDGLQPRHRHPPVLDDHRLALAHALDQRTQAVLGGGDADPLHVSYSRLIALAIQAIQALWRALEQPFIGEGEKVGCST